MMKAKDLRELSAAGLKARAIELRVEHQALREATFSGKEKNHAQLSFLKKDIARADTILREREELL